MANSNLHKELVHKLTDAATNHGLLSEPDHEVGDLQEILRGCWAAMSPMQRMQVYNCYKFLVDEWTTEVSKEKP